MRFFLTFFLGIYAIILKGQPGEDFRVGTISAFDFISKSSARDSTVRAIVLEEFGSTDLNVEGNPEINFYYHVRIRILNRKGLEQGNVSVALQRFETRSEYFEMVLASTFNMEGSNIRETKLNPAEINLENYSETSQNIKFVMPDIQVGSIIEYAYKITSPFVRNLRTWEFQSDIPKQKSVYRTSIPELYKYHVIRKGTFQLKENSSASIPVCQRVNGANVGCAVSTYELRGIPPFYEENYMTSRKNFQSALYFEIKSISRPDGMRDDITTSWKDVEKELRQNNHFGKQLGQRHTAFWRKNIVDSILNEKDTLLKVMKLEEFFKQHFRFNDYYGIFTKTSTEDAFIKKDGNVAEINLSLLSALRFLNIPADPVLLSTRNHGTVNTMFPVLTDFNYLVVLCCIGGKKYFLDATDKALSFAVLPTRCLNGPARWIHKNFRSEFIEIVCNVVSKTISNVRLTLDRQAKFSGQISQKFYGYDAYEKRKEIEEYMDTLEFLSRVNLMHEMKIVQSSISQLQAKDQPLTILLDVVSESENSTAENIYINPLFNYRFAENPFNSKQRLNPIDFAYPREWSFTSELSLPENYTVLSLPENVHSTLDGNGATYDYTALMERNKIEVSSTFSISQTSFAASQYAALKNLFDHAIKTHAEDVIIQRNGK